MAARIRKKLLENSELPPRFGVTRLDGSKLKGECTDVKSGCGTPEGPSLNPQSQFENFFRDTVPLSKITNVVNSFINKSKN